MRVPRTQAFPYRLCWVSPAVPTTQSVNVNATLVEPTVAERSQVFAAGVDAVRAMASLCYDHGLAPPHPLHDAQRVWVALHHELATYLLVPRERRRLEACRAAVQLLTTACEYNRRALLEMRSVCISQIAGFSDLPAYRSWTDIESRSGVTATRGAGTPNITARCVDNK